MEPLTIQEIGSFLSTRYRWRADEDPPHLSWDYPKRALLVILWSLLVYPVLDPDLRKKGGTGSISVGRLLELLDDHVEEEMEVVNWLILFNDHDYIRFQSRKRIVAGTALLGAMDAAKMYKMLRSSVLVRNMYSNST